MIPARATLSRRPSAHRDGAVLIVVLWVLILLSLLVSSLAFEMHVEATITSYYRKRLKSQYLARAGIEWAKMILSRAGTLSEDMEEDYPDLYLGSMQLNRGNPVTGLYRAVTEDGGFTLDLVPEQGRRNINQLTDDDWRELLDLGQVSQDLWDELIDTYFDWVDADDVHRLSGAESDDEFYEDQNYEVKNAPLDTIDELLLIKGFTPGIVYGGPGEEEDDPPLLGIAQWLTTWGNGRVNVNTATPDVLLTLPDMDEFMVEAILEGRAGIDGEFGTEDDGFSNVQEVMDVTGLDPRLAGRLSTQDRQYIRITSVGEYLGVKSGIWCIFRQDGSGLVPMYWREEQML